MAFRPHWYDEQSPSRSWKGGGIRNWSALRIILTFTFGVYLLQMLVFLAGGRSHEAHNALIDLFGLRAWNREITPTGVVVTGLNLLFPIQLFTYMLFHSLGDLFHIGFNMLFVWILGRDLEAALGRRGLLRLYVAAGVIGALVQWAYNVYTKDPTPTVGASGCVYGMLMLYAFKWPHRSFILFPLPIAIPVLLFGGIRVAMDFWTFVMGASGHVAVLVHLGGAAVGYCWFKFGDLPDRWKRTVERKRAEASDRKDVDNRREMDRILAKIQTSGLNSLTRTERAFLDQRSREARRK